MPFIFTPMQLGLLMVVAIFMGFAIAFWMKYPRHWLKWAWYSLRRMDPQPAAYITRNGYLTFDIHPRRALIKKGDNEDTKGYINTGTGVNIAGFGLGNVYYEKCNLPLDISVPTLERKMHEEAERLSESTGVPAHVGYRGISADELGNLWYAWGMWAYDTFRAKAEKATRMGTWIILAIAFITMGLAALIVFRQNEMIGVLKQLIGVVAQSAKSGIQP